MTRRIPQPTGACDLDLEALFASGAMDRERRPGLLALLWAWLMSPNCF